MKNTNNFNFWVPVTIEKGADDNQPMKVKGVASSTAEDADGENLNPSGFDFRPLLDKGFFNYNHKGNEDPGAIIGEPTVAKILPTNELYVEGFLYPNKAGKRTYELAATLEQHSPNRRLGWSIEGQVLERDPMNPKKVLRATITGIAITPMPKNPNTFVSIMKGDYSAPLVEEPIVCPECGSEEISDEKCMKCGCDMKGHLDKSMSTENMRPALPESVEDKKRPIEKGLGNFKKSDIYNLIISKGYSTDPIVVDKIFTLITKTQSTMQDASIEKAIDVAFQNLDNIIKGAKPNALAQEADETDETDEELEKSMKKGKPMKGKPQMNDDDDDDMDDDDMDDDDDDKVNAEDLDNSYKDLKKSYDMDDDDDEMEKAIISQAFKAIEAGMNKQEVIGYLVGKGVTKDTAELSYLHCISSASSEKDGGTVSSVSFKNSLEKGNDSVSLEQVAEIVDQRLSKAVTQMTESLINKFGGLIQKSQEQQELLKAKVERALSQPTPTRSVTRASYAERFEKGQSGVTALSKSSKSDMNHLSERLFNEAQRRRNSGQDSNSFRMLEKAVSDLEIAKATDFRAIQSELSALNIQIIE